MYLTVCPFGCPGSIPSSGDIFQKIFSLADHTLPTHPEPAWQKMAQSPLNSTTHSVDIKEEGLRRTTDRH